MTWVAIIFSAIISIVLLYEINSITGKKISKQKEYISPLNTINDINTTDYYEFDMSARIAIKNNNGLGETFKLQNDLKRKMVYLIQKDKTNILVFVYKGIYTDGETIYTVYTPVFFKEVRYGKAYSVSGSFIVDDVKGNDIYFNLEHSEFTVGYNSLEELYEDAIKPYDGEYKISQKKQ